MLRDELLRSKNDEIAYVLIVKKNLKYDRARSRFVVGANRYLETAATADSHYPEKQQAFLDANDLAQGRYFDEATLPSPTHARARPTTQKVVASTSASNVAPQLASRVTPPPTTDDTRVAVRSDTSTQAIPAVEAPAVDVALATKDATAPKKLPTAHEIDVSKPLVPPDHVAKQPASASVLETPSDSHAQNGTDLKPSPSAAKKATPSLEIPPIRKKPEHRPSLATGSSHAEQPLSPASSIDPYSNNTPVPVAASPATSPGEEVADLAKSGRPSPKQDRSTQARPGAIPSTPDEQLRLEEAQSLQRKPENGVDAARAVSNQVTRISTDQDRMDVDDESTRVPAKQQEPEHKAAVESDSLLRTGSLLNNVEPAGDTTAVPQPERMTTRVSSGAIRHKSVSEILGGSHKYHGAETPDDVARMRFKDRKDREKERNRLSTVVFPKQILSQQDKIDSTNPAHPDSGDAVAKLNEEHDYLFTLFLNRAYAPPRGMNMNTLLASAHKTLSTSNHLLEYQEQMDCRTLRRIYALQNANRWPLRQMKRSVEPLRQGTHWDVVLDHIKWMRTDFREERKWKIAAAKSCADWCAEYVNSDEEHRALLRVNAKTPSPISKDQDSTSMEGASPAANTGDETFAASHPTPDLVPSAEEESVSDALNDEPGHDIHDTVAPAAIFSLASDEFNFSIDMTPAAEKLLDELPLYEPLRFVPETQTPIFKESPDAVWKTELLPVSKFASTKINIHDDERPRKRSRYDYSQYTSDPETRITELPPDQNDVALFRPENKPIRDRIHPGHAFRPPTEHPMPSVGFFESRQSSQWTLAEDDELRRLVKEYAYNWSLISSCLTSPSLFTSGAERRTPGSALNDGLDWKVFPRTSQRTVLAQQQAAAQQQQQASNGQPQPPIRRRTTQPLRVDRRRSSRHLALIDAMRKLAKKRETMLQKQQHASHLASLRKANEANQPKPPISSPAEFSRLKYDREVKLQERQDQYRQQMIAQQRASLAAQRSGQLPNQQQQPQTAQQAMNGQARANNMPPNSANANVANGTPNGVPANMQPNVGVNQNRTQPMQGMAATASVNGQIQANPMAMKIMPQSQLQQNVGARPGMPSQASPDNARVIREANRLQEQQRLLQSRQQQPVPQQQGQPQQVQQQFHNQQFQPQGSHSPNLNMTNVNGTPNNPAMMAALQGQGGMQSPSFHGNASQGVSTPSPRMGQPNPLSSGVVPTISNLQSQIQRANPNWPAEQVNKVATDRLNQYQQQRMSQQAAINAATGGMNNVQTNYQVPHDGNFQTPSQPGAANGGAAMQVPQNQGFSPMMRVPQNNQNRVAPTSSPAMNGVPQTSRSGTPQTQRSGSTQGGAVQGSNKSPHPQAAQTASS
ncbi:hypothetical protein N7492_005073 [Penicillium capsulatum]|uniref:Vacuolar import and degradation protein 21 n=1 Tax=Penicillium capsulatum TaxID=69766 RepID=A0A9W9LRJ9_9EURO|nr:hypothetical protein N7492_005073 [Penicillium capsulatum]